MSLITDIYTVVMVALGAFFFLAGTAGLLRSPDNLSRVHALSEADTLGVGLIVLGLLPRADWPFGGLKLLAIWLLVLLAGATVGQLLGAVAHREAEGR